MPIEIGISTTIGGIAGNTPGGGTPPFSNLHSFSFDGVDDYFLLPSTITLPTDFSVSMWVKASTSGSVRDQVFGGASGFFLFGTVVLNGGANADKMCYNNGSSYVALTPTIRDDQWHNIVITYNSSATNLIAYTDGVETYNATYNAGTNNVIDRISEDTYGNYWNGNLDELAVWKSELSSSDVTAIYNNGEPQSLDVYSPFVWFRMGDNATWNGATWTMTSVGTDTRIARSINMVEANRTTDVPPNPFVNTKSILLDGVDDSVGLGSSTSRKVQTLTMSVWVKPTAFARDGIVLNGHTSYGNQGIEIYWSFNTFTLRINGSFYGLGSGSGQNNWSHILVAYDGNTLKRMTNGVAIADLVVGATINYTNYNGLRLGRSPYGYHIGNIDEFAFWDSDQSANFSTIYGTGVPNDLTALTPLNWYRFEEGSGTTATDSGSGGNDGTLLNGVTRSTDVPTFSKKSIALDGVDDFVDCGNDSSLQIAESITVSAWFKTSDNGNQMVIAGRGHIYSTTLSSWVLFRRTNNGIGVQLRSGNSFQYVLSTSNTYNDGQWHNVIFTRNISSGNLKLYVDGLLQNTTSGVTSNFNNLTQNTTIGADTQSAEFFSGLIDEVAIFNSELSASDATSIYNGGVPNDLASLSPVSWWRCGDGDTAPILTDNGSGGNDGTMTNFTTFSTDVPT